MTECPDVLQNFGQRYCVVASILFATFVFAGCATSLGSRIAGDTPDTFPNHSIEAVLTRLPAFPESLNRVKLEAQIAVASPETDGRFTAFVESRRNDTLFARIKFPMGIEGARVLITTDSAFTYDRIENVVYRGSSSQVKQLFPGSILSLDLIEQATGFVIPDPAVSWELQHDSTRYYIHAPDGAIRYSVDPVTFRIEHIQYRDTDGSISAQRWYLDYRSVKGVVVPTRTIFVQPALDTRLSMSLRALDTNPDVFHFDLGIRADTEWKDLYP